METKEVLFNKDALKAIKTLFLSTHGGLVNIDRTELEELLNCTNISAFSTILNEATTEAIKSSGLLTNVKTGAQNYLLVITGDLSLSLEMVDTVCDAVSEHIKKSTLMLATIPDEAQKSKIKVDLFVMES